MKKSFLRRAMAAAIAVPVALTQTLVCATGFAADETDAAADAITLTIDSLTAVEADTTKNVPVEVERTETTRTYKQVSSWNKVLYGALGSIAASNPTFELDAVAMANVIESEAWYAELLKSALTNGGSAKVDVTTKDVTVTMDINYDYAADIEKVLEQKVPDADLVIDVAPIGGQVVVTVDTENLIDDTTASGRATIVMDGKNMGAQAALDYVQEKLAAIRSDAEASVAFDAELLADVAALFDSYESKLAKAEEKLNKALTLSKEKSFENKESVDAILAEIKDKFADNKYADKIPSTVEEALSKNMVANVLAEALRQINANMDSYKLDVTTDSIAEFAGSLYDISVYGAVNAGNVEGEGSAKSADNITEDEYTALFNYFVELEGSEVAVVNFKTEKVYDASGDGSMMGLNADGELTIERMITYEVVPVEETTTDTTETTVDTTETTVDSTETTVDTTDDSTETTVDTTDTTDDSTETTVDTTDTTDDSTETTVDTTDTTDDSTETTVDTTDDSTETTVDTTDTTDDSTETTVDTTETSDTTGTETTETSDTSDTTGTETTDTSDTSDTSATTETTTKTLVLTATGKTSNFYFSHDDTELTAEMLLDSAYVETFVEGVSQGVEDAMDNITFGVTSSETDPGLTPEQIYNMWGEPYAALPVYAFYTDPTDPEAEPILVDVDIKIYVGVKGDATLDGTADAADAARVLMYAASYGAGNENPLLYTAEYPDVENFAFFLADVNTELKAEDAAELDAADAAKILQYAAWYGGLNTAPTNGVIKTKWDELIA